jgi:hypothetical protein
MIPDTCIADEPPTDTLPRKTPLSGGAAPKPWMTSVVGEPPRADAGAASLGSALPRLERTPAQEASESQTSAALRPHAARAAFHDAFSVKERAPLFAVHKVECTAGRQLLEERKSALTRPSVHGVELVVDLPDHAAVARLGSPVIGARRDRRK